LTKKSINKKNKEKSRFFLKVIFVLNSRTFECTFIYFFILFIFLFLFFITLHYINYINYQAMAPAISDFEAKGWYLTEEGLDSLKSKVDDENASVDDYIEHAKDVNK
jgi:hypothetical protein